MNRTVTSRVTPVKGVVQPQRETHTSHTLGTTDGTRKFKHSLQCWLALQDRWLIADGTGCCRRAIGEGENTVSNALKTPAPVVFLSKLQRACQDDFGGIMGMLRRQIFLRGHGKLGGGRAVVVGSVWKNEEAETWGCEIYQKITGYEEKGNRQFHGQIWEGPLNSPVSRMAIT